MYKAAVITVLGIVALTLGACNTVKGAGRDIQSIGQTGEDILNGN